MPRDLAISADGSTLSVCDFRRTMFGIGMK